MDRAKAFGIKWIGVAVITFSIFGIFYHVSLWTLFFISLIVAGITFIGDLFILQKLNQVIAILGDFALYFILFWGLSILFIEDAMTMLLPALAATYIATLGEAVYHIYMMEKVHETDRKVPFFGHLQTEFAEEENVRTIITDKEKNDKE